MNRCRYRNAMRIEIGRFCHRAGLALACLILAACTSGDAPDYRYRLTVEVATPEGLKTGSSVIQVRQRMVRSSSAPSDSGVSRSVRGEAVAVDLPGGQTLFALLRSVHSVDWAANLMQTLAPNTQEETFEQELDNMLALKSEIVLPRMFPPVGHLPERTAYPMFVTFGDIDNPASVERVDPDDLAATFGEGFEIKRITVQMNDDLVTTGILKRLRWYYRGHENLRTEDFPEGFPVGDFNGLFRTGFE